MRLEVALGISLWLLVLLVLALLFVRTARRMTLLAARTRELAAYQVAVGSIRDRAAVVADPLIARLDEIRRRSGDPAVVAGLVPDAIAALRLAIQDGRALRTPPGLADRTAAILAELQRMERALDLIDHGLSGLVGVRGPRELEIQTTLKRGALNLRHARDGVAAVVADVERLRPADLRPGVPPPALVPRPTPVPLWLQGAELSEEPGSDPSM